VKKEISGKMEHLERGVLDARLVERALRPGRIRETATRLLATAAADPDHAASRLRAGLREAKWLHSAERRLVGDGIYDLLRWTQIIGGTADERWTRWVRWQAEGDPELDQEIAALARRSDPSAIARLAGVQEEVAAELIRAFGAETGAFVLASNTRAAVAIRALGDRAELAESLAKRGIATRPGELASSCLVVEGRFNLEDTPEFRAGRFELQDESGQAAVERAARGIEGEILDFCAGAGGKSLALAARGHEVVAADVRAPALAELEKRARRAGLSIPTRVIRDLPPEWRGRFALVLVDAPCTGTGVWRRHPELRPRSARFRELARTQGELLARAAEAVAPGGVLAYATCSVLPAENDDVFDALLAAHPAFTRSAPTFRWDPHTTGTDGFRLSLADRQGSRTIR
jgi:16S rRNA (cytosine967-C5)-methyltransferase